MKPPSMVFGTAFLVVTPMLATELEELDVNHAFVQADVRAGDEALQLQFSVITLIECQGSICKVICEFASWIGRPVASLFGAGSVFRPGALATRFHSFY
jgi:hypothetical protein